MARKGQTVEHAVEQTVEHAVEQAVEQTVEQRAEIALETIRGEIMEEKRMERGGTADFLEAMKGLRACVLTNENIKQLRAFVKGLRLEKGEDGGRKAELVALLAGERRLRISEISQEMGISAKNVSSLILYLKKDGHKVCTDCEGRKFIEQ